MSHKIQLDSVEIYRFNPLFDRYIPLLRKHIQLVSVAMEKCKGIYYLRIKTPTCLFTYAKILVNKYMVW